MNHSSTIISDCLFGDDDNASGYFRYWRTKRDLIAGNIDIRIIEWFLPLPGGIQGLHSCHHMSTQAGHASHGADKTPKRCRLVIAIIAR